MLLTILHHYLIWHYTRAFGEIRHVAKNLLWFVVHFFSLPQLIRSFFAPYRRMTEERGNTFNLEDLASFVIIGLISRIIGTSNAFSRSGRASVMVATPSWTSYRMRVVSIYAV